MADKERSETETAELNVDSGPQPQVDDQETPEQRARREARRRVLAGGLASAPLILTLASRPAMATYGGGGYDTQKCGYSGMLSGNLSQVTMNSYCKGKPPKHWKSKEDSCKRHFVTGPCNPIHTSWDSYDYSVPDKKDLKDYRDSLYQNYWANYTKISECNEYLGWLYRYPNLDSPPFGDRFSHVFGGGLTTNYKLTMMQALWLDDESPQPPTDLGGPSPLLAHCAAAYCNACEYGEDSFGMSPRDVVELVSSEIRSDPFGLEEMLRMMNDQG